MNEVLNRSENFFFESPDLLRDTGSLRKHFGSLKRRWEGIDALTSERRKLAEETWSEWQHMIQAHQDLQTWISEK